MDRTPDSQPAMVPLGPALRVRAFGLGNAGIRVLELLIGAGFSRADSVAVNTEPLTGTSASEQIQLETRLLRGLGSGGDPERGRSVAEEQAANLKVLCEGIDLVLVVAGLGGGAGSGISPVLARLAKEGGALVLGFVMTPFECEGNRRKCVAEEALAGLQAAADGVVCLPNQKVLKLIDENTSVLDVFKTADQLLADGIRGVLRALTHKGLIDLHFAELCALLRDQHSDCAFAVAEAMGATRSREVLDRLFAHPLLDGGAILAEADSVVVSLTGGPDLTMTEVNRVMEEINRRCEGARVTMGAAIDEQFRERLAVTAIASRKSDSESPRGGSPRLESESLPDQLLGLSGPRPGSRIVPPAPTLPPEQLQQMLARQRGAARSRKSVPRLQQTQLPLEIISKGRFDKSEPTIHKGEDLDVPTYIRRGVSLN